MISTYRFKDYISFCFLSHSLVFSKRFPLLIELLLKLKNAISKIFSLSSK